MKMYANREIFTKGTHLCVKYQEGDKELPRVSYLRFGQLNLKVYKSTFCWVAFNQGHLIKYAE